MWTDGMDVVCRHIEYMMRNRIALHMQQEKLPSFYWLPKLHKTPYRSRFIAASNKCTTKQISTILTPCFKTITMQYCQGIYRHTGVNRFWVIDNSKEVSDRLHNINKTLSAR